jgi:hypothetical protein
VLYFLFDGLTNCCAFNLNVEKEKTSFGSWHVYASFGNERYVDSGTVFTEAKSGWWKIAKNPGPLDQSRPLLPSQHLQQGM